MAYYIFTSFFPGGPDTEFDLTFVNRDVLPIKWLSNEKLLVLDKGNLAELDIVTGEEAIALKGPFEDPWCTIGESVYVSDPNKAWGSKDAIRVGSDYRTEPTQQPDFFVHPNLVWSKQSWIPSNLCSRFFISGTDPYTQRIPPELMSSSEIIQKQLGQNPIPGASPKNVVDRPWIWRPTYGGHLIAHSGLSVRDGGHDIRVVVADANGSPVRSDIIPAPPWAHAEGITGLGCFASCEMFPDIEYMRGRYFFVVESSKYNGGGLWVYDPQTKKHKRFLEFRSFARMPAISDDGCLVAIKARRDETIGNKPSKERFDGFYFGNICTINES